MKSLPRIILLGLIFLLAIYLRIYRLDATYYFGAEAGDNYLAVKNSILSRQIPLLGPPTSHSWLSFGPLFYWLMAPVLALSNYNPLTADYFLIAISIIVLWENYYFVSRLINRSTAFISTGLISISPLWVNMARDGRFFSFVTVFFYPFLYFLIRKNYLLTGIFLGLMLQFHFSPLVFIPFCLIFRSGRIRFLLGLGLTQLPFLLFNLTHGFSMLAQLVVWLPYRTIGMSSVPPTQSGVSAVEFLLTNLSSGHLLLGLVLLFLCLLSFRLITTNRSWVYLWALLVIGLVGIALHRNPPFHYYLPLFPIPLILLGGVLSQFLSFPQTKLLAIGIVTLILSQNLALTPVSTGLTINQQLQAVQTIIKDANGAKYQFTRVGPFDYYPGGYAQNYQYLLWWKGNEPAASSSLQYTIYETTSLSISKRQN